MFIVDFVSPRWGFIFPVRDFYKHGASYGAESGEEIALPVQDLWATILSKVCSRPNCRPF